MGTNTVLTSSNHIRMQSVRDILTDENGVDALQSNDEDFNTKLIMIKKQIENKDHPINDVMR